MARSASWRARFCLLLAPLLLAAQDAPTIVVQGRVVDAKSGWPLSGAAVSFSLDSVDTRTTESDAEGRFRFEDIAPGIYRTSALRSGYEFLRAQSVLVSAEDDEQTVTLELNRYSVIAGRVLDHEGRPVIAAKVTVYLKELDHASLEPYWYSLDMRGDATQSFYRGVTDERGEYRFWGLPKGEVVILAKPTPQPGARWRVRFGSAPMFYPNSPAFDGATRLDLDWGEVREGLDIQLGPPSVTRQSVRALSGVEPCAQCNFAIFAKGGETDVTVASGSTSPTGEIVLEGLPPGGYVVGASARARSGPRAMASMDFLVTPDGDRPFALPLHDPVTVRGRAIFEDPPEEIPEPPASGAPLPQYNFARIMHVAHDWDKLFYTCQRDTPELYGSGSERFFDILAAPGHCRLIVAGPPDSYVAGMSLEGRPLDKPELDVPSGGLPEAVTVRIRFDVGQVTGRVAEADVNTWVHLIPTGADPFAQRQSARVEADGSFLAKAGPGEWKILASRSPRLSPSFDAERLPRVTVKPGETTTLTTPISVID